MTDKDKVLEEFALSEAEKTADALKDLERIEQEVAAEAEASVEDYDAMGDEGKAAAAAETVFEFEQAQVGTDMVGGELAEDK